MIDGQNQYPEQLVFGLDIGTRSIVGTVGYKENEHIFKVVAMAVREHETRAMLDGQIHDIGKVAETITQIRRELERKLNRKLTDVCIAAAGRVLRTITVKADFQFPSETVVTAEHIHSLNLLGVEKAYDEIRENGGQEAYHFYCVGYTVIHYYMNNYAISNLEGHKASKIGTELLATFLPEEVIDGLYASVEQADLFVANLTLEPIAAINVAIPEKYRLLNMALVDVGAGTSDISITKDGSIVAYGMIPFAGDELTECIAKKYLVDFQMAEKIKMACFNRNTVTYTDIMGLTYKIATTDVVETVDETVKMITKSVSDKIIELNGDKPVSAVFVVGGGGKIPGFVSYLAEYLSIPPERVALRGPEVMEEIDFLDPDFIKDSIYVTPVGICLNFYESGNHFIFVNVNGERVKLYDNGKLTIVDAALQIGLPNDALFPKRGKPIEYTLNGSKRLVRGELGEAAIVKLNGNIVGISSPISQNDKIEIVTSTIGVDAEYEVRQLPEYQDTIEFIFNQKRIICPKFVMVNGNLVSGYYNIQNNDEIHILNYYTLQQVLEFMDVEYNGNILVNHVIAESDEKIYENFSIECDISMSKLEYPSLDSEVEKINEISDEEEIIQEEIEQKEKIEAVREIQIRVNDELVTLSRKNKYILVDVLDFYTFDLSVAKGSTLITTINGYSADFRSPVSEGDIIKIYWKK